MNKPRLFRTLCLAVVLAGVSACTGLDQLTKKEPSTPEKQDLFEVQRLADEAYRKDDLAEGEKHYKTLVKEVPGEPLNWFRLGNIYARTQRPDAAVAAYREALIRDPQLTKAWYNMGVVQLKQAAHSFTQLQIYSEKDRPLYEQSQKVVQGILGVLHEEDESGK
jgi:cytochrome c-type biogenesis protein CcmH/NrfG